MGVPHQRPYGDLVGIEVKAGDIRVMFPIPET
jgi:hypothetical protein